VRLVPRACDAAACDRHSEVTTAPYVQPWHEAASSSVAAYVHAASVSTFSRWRAGRRQATRVAAKGAPPLLTARCRLPAGDDATRARGGCRRQRQAVSTGGRARCPEAPDRRAAGATTRNREWRADTSRRARAAVGAWGPSSCPSARSVVAAPPFLSATCRIVCCAARPDVCRRDFCMFFRSGVVTDET
jgi:hypothetical protein